MRLSIIAAHAKLKIKIELRRIKGLLFRSSFLRSLLNPVIRNPFSHNFLKKLLRWAEESDSESEDTRHQQPVTLTPAAQDIYERLKSKIKEVEASRFANRN